MEIIRRFFSFVNRSGEHLAAANGPTSIPGYYLGHTFTAQPSPDELHRAAHILTAKSKKDLERNIIPMLSICFEGTAVVLRDGKHHNCCEYDVRKIVVSCVDAKNQRLLAIFYHNDSPFISSPTKSRGLECHLFLCRTKDIAKSAANIIGDLLNVQYNRPPRKPVNLDAADVKLSKAVGTNEDLDYENISKFFRQKVFNDGTVLPDRSMLSTPCGSLSTCATTTGCDSGRASTSASIDIKTFDVTSKSNGYDHLDTQNNRTIYQNRNSVHYDLEDEKFGENQLRTNSKISYNGSLVVESGSNIIVNYSSSADREIGHGFSPVDLAVKPKKRDKVNNTSSEIGNDTNDRAYRIDIDMNDVSRQDENAGDLNINETCDVEMQRNELERLLDLNETDL